MTASTVSEEFILQAARAIAEADALLIGAGAGMGVDSGLPDFRDQEGFWKAYPPFRGRSFASMSNPAWFDHDPEQAWGFFVHRLNLYRDTPPHAGFEIVRRWAESRPAGYFVCTSNVDGHFARADFDEDRILECHGSIHLSRLNSFYSVRSPVLSRRLAGGRCSCRSGHGHDSCDLATSTVHSLQRIGSAEHSDVQ